DVLVEALQPRGGIDGVAEHRVLQAVSASQATSHQRTGENPNAHADDRPTLCLPALIELSEGALHGQGTLHGTHGILADLPLTGVRPLYPKERHNGISDVFVDHAVMEDHLLGYLGHELVQPVEEILGREFFGHGSKSLQVGKEYCGDQLPGTGTATREQLLLLLHEGSDDLL